MLEFIKKIYNECSVRDGYDACYGWSWTSKFDKAINSDDAIGALTNLRDELGIEA